MLDRTGPALLILLVITGVVRLAVALLLPQRVLSEDIRIWESVTHVLLSGGNPYATTDLLYYPPLWMQVLFVLGKLSNRTHISLAHLIQAVLIGIDLGIVLVVYLLLRTLGLGRRAFQLTLIGIALNPISILLTCEHGNFDSLVGLLMAAMAFALVAWNRGATPSVWLLACLAAGLGILAKTVPLIATPILLVRWRATDWAARVVGAALLSGPALLGVSVLYVLNPRPVAANIFGYRSAAGWFGITGLLNLVGGAHAMAFYTRIFPVIALAVLVGAALAIGRARSMSDRSIIAASTLLLAWVPALGSGYGPQYIAWFIPLGVVLFAVANGSLRFAIAGFAIVALATYLAEYAFIPTQGAFFTLLAPHTAAAIGRRLSPPGAATLLRLPLFAAYLVALTVGLRALVRSDLR